MGDKKDRGDRETGETGETRETWETRETRNWSKGRIVVLYADTAYFVKS